MTVVLKIFFKKYLTMNLKNRFEKAGITYEHRLD